MAFLEFKVKPKADLQGLGNATAIPHRGLYVQAPLDWGDGGLTVNMLLDSGATASLLDVGVYERIPMGVHPLLYDTDVQVTFADGHSQKMVIHRSVQAG